MRHKWSAFFERNADVPEVESALKSAKILTETKTVFLHRLSFEAEPADFEKVLADWNLTKLNPEERNG